MVKINRNFKPMPMPKDMTNETMDSIGKPKKKVIVEITKGIAEVTQCPEDIEVEIIDHNIIDI